MLMICLILIDNIMKNTINITLLGLSLIIIATACHKKNEPCPTEFQVPGKSIPYSKSYHLGDTLTLQSFYHYMIYEKNTNKYYNMKKLDIKAGLMINSLDTLDGSHNQDLSRYVYVIPNNNYKYNIQFYSDGSSVLVSNILIDRDTFRNEIKIVFNKKGSYLLTYGPSSLMNKMDFEGKGRCTDFNLFTIMNAGLDNNIDLLKESPDEHFNTWILQKPEDRFYRGASFAYRVIK